LSAVHWTAARFASPRWLLGKPARLRAGRKSSSLNRVCSKCPPFPQVHASRLGKKGHQRANEPGIGVSCRRSARLRSPTALNQRVWRNVEKDWQFPPVIQRAVTGPAMRGELTSTSPRLTLVMLGSLPVLIAVAAHQLPKMTTLPPLADRCDTHAQSFMLPCSRRTKNFSFCRGQGSG
jgi:hypothetical protein